METLLPPRALAKATATMAEGEGTHGQDEWRNHDATWHLAAAVVHIGSALKGDESEDHIIHAVCRLMMCSEQRIIPKEAQG